MAQEKEAGAKQLIIGAEQEHKSKSDILYPIKSWILRVMDTRNSLSAMTYWKKYLTPLQQSVATSELTT